MDREKRRKLRHSGLETMEKLDIPCSIAPQVPRMELVGNRSFYMDRHRGVISYTTETVDIAGGAVAVRVFGRELQIEAMTDDELRISGMIERIELVE